MMGFLAKVRERLLGPSLVKTKLGSRARGKLNGGHWSHFRATYTRGLIVGTQ